MRARFDDQDRDSLRRLRAHVLIGLAEIMCHVVDVDDATASGRARTAETRRTLDDAIEIAMANPVVARIIDDGRFYEKGGGHD